MIDYFTRGRHRPCGDAFLQGKDTDFLFETYTFVTLF
jgi:hypothetical protein